MPDETPPAPVGEPKPIDQAVLHSALKAFKKRIKAVRLDDESRLGGHGLSSGRQSGIVGITPPNLYPREVWDELVRVGRLRKTRDGLYEMTEL
jgi:hypothetical protein